MGSQTFRDHTPGVHTHTHKHTPPITQADTDTSTHRPSLSHTPADTSTVSFSHAHTHVHTHVNTHIHTHICCHHPLNGFIGRHSFHTNTHTHSTTAGCPTESPLVRLVWVTAYRAAIPRPRSLILYYCLVEGSLRLKLFIAVALIVVNMTNKPPGKTASSFL